MEEEERAKRRRRIVKLAEAEQRAAGRYTLKDPTSEVLRAIFDFFT
jgi:hypothetical protein